MKVRLMLAGAAVLAGTTLAPVAASAQGDLCGGLTYSVTLGLGGAFSGCFQFQLTELGENAGGIGAQYYWTNAGALLGGGAPNNASSLGAGTFFFNDDCHSNGAPGSANFKFCNGVDAPVLQSGLLANLTGELVIGMNVTQPGENGGVNYWIYSGASVRNTYPAPNGFQQVLYQLTVSGVPLVGEYLFAWEDINSSCINDAGSALHPSLTTFPSELLTDKPTLDDPNNCSVVTGTTTSDNDFNDSYIQLHIVGFPQENVVPEPATMLLLATGLVGMSGAALRRSKRS